MELPVVVVGLQPWDVPIGSNCKNLALEFAKTRKVLYVNAPLDRNTSRNRTDGEQTDFRERVIKGLENPLVQVGENIWTYYPRVKIESINKVPFGWLFDWLNYRNNQKFAAEIDFAIQKMGFGPFWLFNDNDLFRTFYLKDLLKPETTIFYIRDYLLSVPYWKKHGQRIEPKHLAKADVVTANSTYLADYAGQYNKHSYYVGQGCDTEVFSDYRSNTKPADLQHIKGPIIGYVGALLKLRLDIGLLEELAIQNPDFSIVLVGPEDDAFKASKLHEMPNVHFTGAKKPEQMPEYIHAFDVCLNPQIVNEATIGNYPRKIDEYLAMGKPTIATKTRAMEVFADYCYLTSGASGYAEAIRKALYEDNESLQNARRAFAGTHTWKANAEEIYKAVALAK